MASANLADGAVTNQKLDTATQASLGKAATSVQSVNGKTPTSGNLPLATTDLSDVLTPTPANGDVLTYDSVAAKWKSLPTPAAPVTSVAGQTSAVTGAQIAADSALKATYGRPGYNLLASGLNDSTADIHALIAAAATAGHTYIVVPYRAAAWPATTTLTASGITIEFEPGARISFNLPTAGGMDLTNCRLINASFTSPYTGLTSAGDWPNYGYPAREVRLHDGNRIEGGYYHENAPSGLHLTGAHNRVGATHFKNIRHRTGWGNAIHNDGSLGSVYNNTFGSVWVEDSDRACETEDGAHDVVFTSGGHLKNVYPNGYTGQPVDASGPDAAAYANYTFVLDAHAHSGSGGVQNIVYEGDWFVENCGGGVTCIRSTGTSDADYPRNCRWGNIHVKGRGLATGYETVAMQGHNNRVGNVFLELGAGISASTLFRARIYGGEGNALGDVRAEAFSLPLVQVDAAATGTKIGLVVPTDAVQNGSGYLVDVAGPRTLIDGLTPIAVGGTSGYLRFQAGSDASRARNFDYTLKAGETFTTPVVIAATGVTVNDGPIIAKNTGVGNFIRLVGTGTSGTANTLGNGTLRMIPFYLPNQITIDQIGGEVTIVGDAGCVIRLGIYTDNQGLPGSPLVDATIPGDAVAVPMTAITALTLPRGWYWTGGVVQGVTTTQPTVRTTSSPGQQSYPVLITAAATATQNNHYGESKGSVTGALPAWGSSIGSTSTAPLVIVRLA